MDRVALGAGELYQILTGDKAMFLNTLRPTLTLPQLWQRIENDMSKFVPAEQRNRKLTDFGAIFELNNVSPRPIETLIGGDHSNEWDGGQPIPQFVFEVPQAPIGPGGAAANLLTTFRIMFFDDQFKTKQVVDLVSGTTPNGVFKITRDEAVFQPSDALWNKIADRSGTVRWVISGRGLDPRANYWSDQLALQVNL